MKYFIFQEDDGYAGYYEQEYGTPYSTEDLKEAKHVLMELYEQYIEEGNFSLFAYVCDENDKRIWKPGRRKLEEIGWEEM